MKSSKKKDIVPVSIYGALFFLARSELGMHKPIRKRRWTGRNQMCRCGSGKKFKRCCLYRQG